MKFDSFIESERQGWDVRADGYCDATAMATVQIIPGLLDAVHPLPGERLLDLACGPGQVAGAAAALGLKVEGIDYAPAMIAAAKRRFPDQKFTVADAEALPHENGVFDIVLCNMGLFHMGDTARAMAEAARVLRHGGRFAFSQWVSPEGSELYGRLFAVLKKHADLSRADPAPDAYALSDQDTAFAQMKRAGFTELKRQDHPTRLIATGDDFFDFFMRFGVRVPLIVAAQDADIQNLLRQKINAAMAPFRTATGYDVPMPSLIYSGVRQ